MSRITIENQDDISKFNPLDSFQQDLGTMKSYFSQSESVQYSPSKIDFGKETDIFESEESLELNSPDKMPFGVCQTEQRPRNHKFRSGASTTRKTKLEKTLSLKKDKYLLNLAKKFNPAFAK
mmetsp:Transcript_31003/g.27428  ORF Transcript_31003/g.27428 Transcript_31003/m.27428 type:complete len:122 (-) Transcript_31003:286-651(-)